MENDSGNLKMEISNGNLKMENGIGNLKPIFALCAFLAVVFFISCGTTKKIESTQPGVQPAASLKKENKYFLMNKIASGKFKFKWIRAHFNVDLDNDSVQNSFGGIVLIRQDSIIWMNITAALGTMSAACIQLEQDSIMFKSPLNETYFKTNYDHIDSVLGEDLDFDLIHSVMLGNTLDFYDDTANMKAYFDGHDYILTTIPKRKLKKLVYKNKPIHIKNDIQLIWINPTDFHIEKVKLEDYFTHRIFLANYDDFKTFDSISFPTHIHYEIDAEKVIKIDLTYKKIEFTREEKTPFYIPKKYREIHY